MNTNIRSALLLILLIAVFFTASFIARVAWISSEQLNTGRQLEQSGKYQRALVAYERAIHAYLPFLSARENAISDIKSLNLKLESQNNRILALEGWRRLRGALLSGRSIFGQPDSETLNETNLYISRLSALTDQQGKMPKNDIEKEAARFLSSKPDDVSQFWAAAQFLFLIGWIGLTCQLIWVWQRAAKARRIKLLASSLGAWLAWLGSLWMAG